MLVSSTIVFPSGVSVVASIFSYLVMYVWKLQIGWDSVMRMSVDLRDLFLYEAFLYYNPLLLVVNHDGLALGS
ncbi:hypothetical protein CK203_103511 [Vitis vinifera]|uniref:Uncharacterized protein n=1 Tax=Vitis vinifera TaxID=29760 RepID=A0A438CQM7_VITVI|nr:hypothetical protein CK203_103511 [Vitis vinifera]